MQLQGYAVCVQLRGGGGGGRGGEPAPREPTHPDPTRERASAFLHSAECVLGEGALSSTLTQARFIESALQRSNARWKVCVWHMTMHEMQTSYKGDATGWEVYEICRKVNP
jgi:hypothetical protein